MKSHSISTLNSGFTLIEALIILGILGLILAVGITVGFDTLRRSSIGKERSTIVTILERARSRAVNNIHGNPHGIHFTTSSYVLFEGSSFASSVSALNETFTLPNSITMSGPTNVLFSQLSGDATTTPVGIWSINLMSGGGSSTINLNNEGNINY